MLIEVFGPGCAKCETLHKHANEAVKAIPGDHQVVKISDYAVMISRGILSTPALAVDGVVKVQGHVPSTPNIITMLKG